MPECFACHAEIAVCVVHDTPGYVCDTPLCQRCSDVWQPTQRGSDVWQRVVDPTQREGENMPAVVVPRATPVCRSCRTSRDVVRRSGALVHGTPLFRCESCGLSERVQPNYTCPHCDHSAGVIARMDTDEQWCLRCDHAIIPCRECGLTITDEDGRCVSCVCVPRLAPNFKGEPTPVFPRYVGLEIECGHGRQHNDDDEGAPPLSRTARLAFEAEGEVDSDGSLVFGDWSMEFKPFPARGDALVERTTRVGALLKQVGAMVNRSCGLHVHVDARDFTSSDVLKLARLNAKIESALYGIVSRSRRANHFSLPWRESLLRPADVEASMTLRTIRETASTQVETVDPKGDDPQDKRAMAVEANLYGSVRSATQFKRSPHKHSQRYHGLNLTSLPLLGTVEFRHHQGTVNARKILMWSAVCTAVIEYAKNHTEEEIVRLRGTPAECLDKILRGEALRSVRAWVRCRRAFFQVEEHGRPVPRGRAVLAEPPEPLDVSTEHEDSESGEIGSGGRIGRPGHRGD